MFGSLSRSSQSPLLLDAFENLRLLNTISAKETLCGRFEVTGMESRSSTHGDRSQNCSNLWVKGSKESEFRELMIGYQYGFAVC